MNVDEDKLVAGQGLRMGSDGWPWAGGDGRAVQVWNLEACVQSGKGVGKGGKWKQAVGGTNLGLTGRSLR
jgi:hypothetical protein